jgi:succinate dehydrogenase/fumarate reductase-like Fe-S protein
MKHLPIGLANRFDFLQTCFEGVCGACLMWRVENWQRKKALKRHKGGT